MGFIIFILVSSCNILVDTDSGAAPKDKDCSEAAGRATRILFIGNHLLDEHNLPKVFKDLACSKGAKTEIYSITAENFRFQQHSNNEETLELIRYKLWDFVVLQNQGQIPSLRTEVVEKTSLPYAEDLADAIYARYEATEIIYLQTWGRLFGDQTNCAAYALVCTLAGHTEALANGYEIYQNATGGQIAYAGNAFLAVYNDQNAPFDPQGLWHADGARPSFAGTYLAASVLFAKIFNSSPVGAMPMKDLGQENAQYLQEIAAQI